MIIKFPYKFEPFVLEYFDVCEYFRRKRDNVFYRYEA